jgi:hypothetical protein
MMRHGKAIREEATELSAAILTGIGDEIGEQRNAKEIVFDAALGAAYAWRDLSGSDNRPPIIPPGTLKWSEPVATKVETIVNQFYADRPCNNEWQRQWGLCAAVKGCQVNLFSLSDIGNYWTKDMT